MIYKKLSLLILFFATGLLTASAQKSPQDMDRFIDALMKKMTTEEKIGQLNLPVTGEITTGQAKSSDIAGKIKKGEVGGLFNLKGVEKIREVQKQAVEESRLGIPLLFGMDVIHGYETMFPIPLGLSCTWDMAAIEESARIAAVEASADGISWTFSPMVDISRDPRWGRVSEGNGEDPFLGAMIAEAMVRGYQGKDMKRNDEIMACVKHFALYGASEAGRDYNTVDMSRQRMFNDYMLPYEAAVEAGVGSVMASFNEVDGIPATANKWLMTDILRGQWGFNGFVVTDYTGISEMIDHGIGDLQTVTARAFNAGVDMDMVSEGFVGTLKKSIQEGKVSMETLNTACRRILAEFGLPGTSHIVNGHVPVREKSGESPIKGGGRLVVIDGGFCRAYHEKTGIAGYTLVYSSRTMSLRTHQPFVSAEKAVNENIDIVSQKNILETENHRILVEETDEGETLRERVHDLKQLVKAYQLGWIKETCSEDCVW